MQCELDEGDGLPLALKWLRRALYLVEVREEGLRIAVARQLSSIPACVRNGALICDELVHDLSFIAGRSNMSADAALLRRELN